MIKANLLIAIYMALLIFVSFPAMSAASGNLGQGSKPVPYTGEQKPYHGNIKTMKYHNQHCDHYECKTCTKIFKTSQEAVKAGYKPCGKCGG